MLSSSLSARLYLVGLVALVAVSHSLVGPSSLEDGEGAMRLLRSCGRCRSFVPKLRDVASERYPHDTDGAGRHADADLCMSAFPTGGDHEFQAGCLSVAGKYGLDLVETLVAAAPDAICAELPSCVSDGGGDTAAATAAAATAGADVLLSAGDRGAIIANLVAGAVAGDEDGDNDEDEEEDADEHRAAETHAATHKTAARTVARARVINTDRDWVKAHCTGGSSNSACPGPAAITEIMAQGMAALQQRQMEEMQQQQQQMMTLNVLRMRMLSVMQSNRAIKKAVAKAERHMPGHCPCCHGCVAPAMQFGGF